MNNFRLGLLALVLMGCDYPENSTVLLSNNSSKNIFYRHGVDEMEIDGKEISSSMGTLKPQESKEFTSISYRKSLTNPKIFPWVFLLVTFLII